MPRRLTILFAALLLVFTGPSWGSDTLVSLPVRETFVEIDVRGRLAVGVTSEGAVWVSRDEGLIWNRSLREIAVEATDDTLVLELEDLVIQALEAEVEAIEPDEDAEDAAEEAEAQLSGDASDRLNEAIERHETRRVLSTGGQVRIEIGRSDQLAMSRKDGTWISKDAGQNWSRVTRQRAIAMERGESGWLLVLPNGSVLSEATGYSVEPLGQGVVTARVADLDEADGVVWAATDLGLWRHDAQGWSPTGTDTTSLRGVSADPGWEGGLWLDDGEGILRSDDGGETRRRVSAPVGGWGPFEVGPPVAGGGLIVLNDEGIWVLEGSRWSRGYTGRVSDAIWTENGLWVASEDGLLGPSVYALTEDQEAFVELGLLLAAATRRPGLETPGRVHPLLRSSLPEVMFEAKYKRGDNLTYNKFTTAETDGETQLWLRLTWTPPGRERSLDDGSRISGDLNLRAPTELAVGRVALVSRSSSVGRGQWKYRARVVDTIAGLYDARRQLMSRATQELDLIEAVRTAIEISLLEAQMDALSDGAISDWRAGTNTLSK